MRIDNRLLIPVLGPFGALLSARLFWAIAGLPWQPEPVGIVFLWVGAVAVSGLISGVLWAEGTSIGHTTIGRTKP